MENTESLKYDYPNRPTQTAAPPDDGGHQGSYTRPQDMLQEPEPGFDRNHAAPELHYNNAFPRTSSPQVPVGGILAALLLTASLIALFFYAFYG